MLNNTKFVQKVKLLRGNTFLLIQRSSIDDTNPNMWDLPGGNVERGEDLQGSLRREVQEETGLIVERADPQILTGFMMGEIFVIGAIYSCPSPDGEVVLSNEHQQYKWVTSDEVGNIDIQPWLKPYL